MEQTFRRKTVVLCYCLICFLAFGFRGYSQRALKADKVREGARQNLFDSAERWLGVRELTGHNDHPMITKAMKLCGLPGNAGYPWCAAAQAEIHETAGLNAPTSARVVDWFEQNVVWLPQFGEVPVNFDVRGMVGALYYRKLGRYGHIVLIIGEDKNNYYCYEGNTSFYGSKSGTQDYAENLGREGDGFYRTIRSKESIAALADYCLSGKLFFEKYDGYLQKQYRVMSKEFVLTTHY